MEATLPDRTTDYVVDMPVHERVLRARAFSSSSASSTASWVLQTEVAGSTTRAASSRTLLNKTGCRGL